MKLRPIEYVETFGLTQLQMDKLKEWQKEHKEVCTLPKYRGAIGGGSNFVFSPNSLGYGVSYNCDCGATIDLTDYESW